MVTVEQRHQPTPTTKTPYHEVRITMTYIENDIEYLEYELVDFDLDIEDIEATYYQS